jgi:hypothetical protein
MWSNSSSSVPRKTIGAATIQWNVIAAEPKRVDEGDPRK